MIIDSYAIVRNNTERSNEPLTQFSPKVTSYKTAVQYHGSDIDTVKIQKASVALL